MSYWAGLPNRIGALHAVGAAATSFPDSGTKLWRKKSAVQSHDGPPRAGGIIDSFPAEPQIGARQFTSCASKYLDLESFRLLSPLHRPPLFAERARNRLRHHLIHMH